jgi:beta-galactosidase
VIERKKLEVVTTAKKLADRIRLNDPTRPVTSALAAWDADWEIYDPLAAQHDIVGYNYMIHKSESDHARVPERVMMQTESYPRDAFSNWAKVNDYPYIIGDFVWTSLDYLGEAGIGRFYYKGESEGEHYHRPQYPWHGAYCGDIDITGWRKPISHYRDLLYNEDKKMHLAVKEPNGYYGDIKETQWSVWPTWESWNWPGHEGKTIEVEIYSRYPRVQLYLNGHLMGEQPTSRDHQFKAVYALNYEPGTLRAVGIDEAGNVREERILTTAGEPAKIRLTADKRRMKADGQDLIYVIAEVVDKQGRVMPIADNRLQFTLRGAGIIEATGSADLKDSEAYSGTSRKVWKGRAMAVVRSTSKKGKITLKVSSPGLSSASVVLTAEK